MASFQGLGESLTEGLKITGKQRYSALPLFSKWLGPRMAQMSLQTVVPFAVGDIQIVSSLLVLLW